MTDAIQEHTPLFMDELFDQGWYHPLILTNTYVVSANLKPGKQSAVHAAIASNKDLPVYLKSITPLGAALGLIELKNFQRAAWHEDESFLELYEKEDAHGKSRSLLAYFSSRDNRQPFIDHLTDLVGPCERSEVPASIWHVGMGPIIYSTMAILACGLLAWAGFAQDSPADVDNVRGRGRGLAVLLNAVGPVGMLVIGGAVVAAMMIRWYIRCLNPPAKVEITTIAK
ncbi:MAG: hypothetical protein KF777_23975 [Planctomycetaceae bacterium]|nr:hypothetical protein [Planctomycetaceae bacterium]